LNKATDYRADASGTKKTKNGRKGHKTKGIYTHWATILLTRSKIHKISGADKREICVPKRIYKC